MKNSKNCTVLEQRPFFLQKTVKLLPHKNIFTHSFVSIDNYLMSEVSNKGLEKCKKKIDLKKINMLKMFILKDSIGDIFIN
jgi:hypothetical protein